MKTNADCTWYAKSINASTRSEVWTRHEIVGVLWEDRKAANVVRSGLLEADSVAVYIPFYPGFQVGVDQMQIGDILVKGIVNEEINGSFTITALKAKYPHSVTVRSVDTMDQGSARMHHWQVGGK